MQIESLEIRNFRLLRDARLTGLPPMVVVVGPNGSGKSTLLDVLSFMKDALAQNVAQAVARRGGIDELVSRGATGPISITMTLRSSGEALVTYKLSIECDSARPVVGSEKVTLRPSPEAQTLSLVDFAHGVGSVSTIPESTHAGGERPAVSSAHVLDDPSTLAIKGFGQFKEFRIVSELRSLIEGWHLSDVRPSEARASTEAGHAEHLSPRGENLAQVARYLLDHHPDRFDQILEAMRQRVPGIERIEAGPTEDGRLVLHFEDGAFKDPFSARHVSDGTLRLFAYLVLLYDPEPHPLLAIEEPESQLYPDLLLELIEELRGYAARGGQVLVSTHSPDLLNGARLDEVYWLTRKDGFTTVSRACQSELLQRLVAEGDSSGALWRQGLFDAEVPGS